MKKNLFIVMALVLALGAVGCSKQEEAPATPPVQEEAEDDKTEEDDRSQLEEEVAEVDPEQLVIPEGSFVEQVSSFFILSKTEKNYFGDYEMYITLDNLSANDDGTVMLASYNGVMGDRSKFKVDYLVRGEEVIEQMYVLDKDGKTVGTHLNSVMTDPVILSGSIEEGNSWEFSFLYEGKSRLAKTTIKEVGADSFTTETVIEGMEGYENETYIETRTYALGKGLVSMYHTLPADEESKTSNVVGYAQE